MRGKRLKKSIGLFLFLSMTLQTSFGIAAVTPDQNADAVHKPLVTTANNTPIVNIAPTNDKGLSHNRYQELNVDQNGLVLNNSMNQVNTQLAGQISGNSNLHSPAKIILNEVTGMNRTNLNGLIEVAGNRADVIIANPNGITGNGFGFINTSRAVLTTGRPQIDTNGTLTGFRVTGGDVSIEGIGMPEDKMENGAMPDRLDILTRAAKINAQLWAKNDMNIVVGKNDINYTDLKATALPVEAGDNVPQMALDASAVGSMYAGKITLVGTEKGLGVNLGGQLQSDSDITLDTNGNLSIDNAMEADGNIKIAATGDIKNNNAISAQNGMDISSKGNVDIAAGAILSAGQVTNDDNNEDETVPADITIKADGNIISNGSIEASKNINFTANKVNYDKLNTVGQNVNVSQTAPPDTVLPTPTPLPQQPAKPNARQLPDLVTIPDYANSHTTKQKNKENNLPITADDAAPNANKPIIDKAANGVDLVEIAAVDKSGVSKNIYKDFNVNQRGLIFNNSAKYADTKLGGYIDKNNNLALGHEAKTILNETTGNMPTKINGYMEIAGVKADLIIANPNGIAVNGGCYINTANAELMASPKRDILIEGNGLNAQSTDSLILSANNITNDASELWTNSLSLSADGKVTNTGKISSYKDIEINADSLNNDDEAIIKADNNLAIKAGTIANNNAAMAAGDNINIVADKLSNTDKAEIYSESILKANIKGELQNVSSYLAADADSSITANSLENMGGALLKSGNSLQLYTVKNIDNNASLIESTANMSIAADKLINENKAVINSGTVKMTRSGTDLVLSANNITNTDAVISVIGNLIANATDINNTNGSAIYVDGNNTMSVNKLTNDASILAAGAKADIDASTIENKNSALIYSGEDMQLYGQDYILNSSADVESEGRIDIITPLLTNEKTAFDTAWSITNQYISYGIPHWNKPNYYAATREFNREIKVGTIIGETPTAHISSDKDINIAAGTLNNHYSEITAGKELNIKANNVNNIGYQGTNITTDTGQDIQKYKYNKTSGSPLHRHHRTVYGDTRVSYYNQDIDNQTDGSTNLTHGARSGVLSGRVVAIDTGNMTNLTYDAGKNLVQTRPTGITAPTVDSNTMADNLQLDIAKIENSPLNGKEFTINKAPESKYLIETNPQFANLHNFLSSDYLLQRVKADPTKVAKRLGDGYYEEKEVIDQLTNLTGRKYTDDYASAMDEYKVLMDNGAVFADKYNLSIGVELTKEQMAALTSDIVWLVKENVNGEDVLVPKVYMAHLNPGDLKENGALVTGTDVSIITDTDLTNIGTIKADNALDLKADNLTNENGSIKGKEVNIASSDNLINSSAEIAGADVNISAKNIVNKTNENNIKYGNLNKKSIGDTASISAQNNLSLSADGSITNTGAVLNAGKDLTLFAKQKIDIGKVSKEEHVAVAYGDSSAKLNSVENLGSSITAGNNVNMNAKDITMQTAGIEADNDINLTAANNIDIKDAKNDEASDVSVGSKSGNFYVRQQNDDEDVIGTSILAKGNINLGAGKDINVTSSGINSVKGKVDIKAKDNININRDTEKHEDTYEFHKKDSGFLKSKTVNQYDHSVVNKVVGSNIEGADIKGKADEDININASNVLADNSVSLEAGKDINISSVGEDSSSYHFYSLKKSGIIGGGLGVTIGKESSKDKLENKTVEQVGSTVGAIKGDVNIKTNDNAKIKGSNVIAGHDIDITAGNVAIENTNNIYYSKKDHEYKKSGISISLGGAAVSAVENIKAPIDAMHQAEDGRLKALYGKKAYDQIKNVKDTVNGINKNGIKSAVGVNVGFGSSKSESHSISNTIEAVGSNVFANNDVHITANKDSAAIKGSTVSGNDISITAKKDINITAAQNSNKTDASSSSSSGFIGASVALNGAVGYSANKNSADSNLKANSITHTGSSVIAKDKLKTDSGKDTDIIGSTISGNKIDMTVGGNLNIESVQDTDNYNEHNSTTGIGIDKAGTTGALSKGKINSAYQSTTDQAGIYAGDKGFNINVGKNTYLKGAVIASDADTDKNKLSTGSITYEDIANSASYDAHSTGINYDSHKRAEEKNKGLTPNIGMGAKGDVSGSTHSAIAPGTIDIRDNPKQDISDLDRDTKNSLNKLDKIFNKKKILEKQQAASMFGELGYKVIGDIGEKLGWKEDDPRRIALHGAVGEVMAQINGGKFGQGLTAFAINDLVINQLGQIKDKSGKTLIPSDILQGAAAGIGELTGGYQGAAIAASDVKNNRTGHRRYFEGEVTYQNGQYYRYDMKNDKDDPIERPTYDNILVWMQKPNDPDNGEDYLINTDLGNFYIPFDIEKTRMIFTEIPEHGNLPELNILGEESVVVTNYAKEKEDSSFNLGSSIAQNGATELAELPNDYAKYMAKVDELAKEFRAAQIMGKVPGWLASGLGVYQDYQKYSGGDFMIAAGADIVLPTAGGIAGAAVTANPITGAVIGAIGATLGDKVASIAKDKYAVTDGKKHDNSN